MNRQAARRPSSVRRSSAKGRETESVEDDFWQLHLYVAGKTPRAESALMNLGRVCESHLRGRYTIEVIDLLVHPRLASADQIVALPTLVRRLPAPVRKVIGDLSNLERLLVDLDLRAGQVPP